MEYRIICLCFHCHRTIDKTIYITINIDNFLKFHLVPTNHLHLEVSRLHNICISGNDPLYKERY